MILVTGGTGLLGSHLLFELCNKGIAVRATKRSTSNLDNVKKVFSYYTSDIDTLLKKIEWVEVDFLDVYSLINCLEGVEQVYHCAAVVSFEKGKEDIMMQTNAIGTANLVNACLSKNVKKLCHVSSITTVGEADKGELSTENSLVQLTPESSNYTFSKYDAEREVWRGIEEGLDAIIVNPSLILGGGNWQQSSANLFTKAHDGLKFYTAGGSGFIDVRDVARLMVLLMDSEHKNERVILNTANLSYKDFFDKVHKVLNKKQPSIKAGPLLSGLAWRMEKVRCLITGKNPLITKETALSAQKTSKYSNEKLNNFLPDYSFIPIDKSIKEWGERFKLDTTY